MFIVGLLTMNQEWKQNQMSTSGWLDKQNVFFTYNGILFNHKKDQQPNGKMNKELEHTFLQRRHMQTVRC